MNAWAIIIRLSMLTQNVFTVGCFQRILSRQFPEVTPTRPLSLPPLSLDVRNYWQSVICSRRPTELLYLIYRHLREPWPLPLAYCQDCLSLAVAVILVYDDDVFTTICSIAHAHLAWGTPWGFPMRAQVAGNLNVSYKRAHFPAIFSCVKEAQP